MTLQESGEMYLESIYVLSQQSTQIRAIDVCSYMGLSKPSVSRAMSILKAGGYVYSNENGFLFLTEAGLNVATKIYEKRVTISRIFKSLGVSKNAAEADACRIEHIISDETFAAIKKFESEYLLKNKTEGGN